MKSFWQNLHTELEDVKSWQILLFVTWLPVFGKESYSRKQDIKIQKYWHIFCWCKHVQNITSRQSKTEKLQSVESNWCTSWWRWISCSHSWKWKWKATLVNTSDVDSSLLHSAIISSVADAPSTQGKKSCKKLPFSTQFLFGNSQWQQLMCNSSSGK